MILNSFTLITIFISVHVAWTLNDDRRYDPNIDFFYPDSYTGWNSGYRVGRNPNSGNGPRFGWQNPILRAPTLAPLQSYTTTPRIIFEDTTRPYIWNSGGRLVQPPRTNPSIQWPTDPNRGQGQPSSPYERPGNNRPIPSSPGYGNRPEPLPTSAPYTGTTTPKYYPRPGTSNSNRPRPPQPGVKNCPPQTRLSTSTNECTYVGSVCGENMNFYADPTNPEYGHCDCSQELGRPLVYHPETRRCYFVFQQAYCKEHEWLVFGNPPSCQVNPCRAWAKTELLNWNWTDNSPELARRGPVALLDERKCTTLGSPCAREAQRDLTSALNEAIQNQSNAKKGISLVYDSGNLICRRDNLQARPKAEQVQACKPWLFNKWRIVNRCNQQENL